MPVGSVQCENGGCGYRYPAIRWLEFGGWGGQRMATRPRAPAMHADLHGIRPRVGRNPMASLCEGAKSTTAGEMGPVGAFGAEAGRTVEGQGVWCSVS